MKNDKNDSSGGFQSDDGVTGEYPVVFDAIHESTDSLPALNGAAHDVTVERPALPAGEDAQVTAWLADLEAEIARLHDRWRDVEQGFNAKDSVIAELKEEIATRDGTLAELRERLDRNTEGLKSLEGSLAEKIAEVAKLSADVTRHATTHEQNVAAIAAAAEAHALAQRDLDAARAEVAKLRGDVAREQVAMAALAARNDELLAAQAAMTQRIQELETYIDGRAQSWSGLKSEIAEQKNAILRLEKGLKTKDVAIEDAARAKRDIEQKLLDLERQNSELAGRRKEREAAYDELQRKLAEHFAAAEQLKADLAKRVADHDRLTSATTSDRALIATLEAAVRDKDSALTALEARLAMDRSVSEERQRALELELAARDTELAKTREQAVQQTELATTLKTELDAKRTSVDMLQRSVHRISNLGASLAELERRIDSSKSTKARQDAETPTVNAESVAAPPAELLPLESFMRLDGSDDTAKDERSPKLIGSVGGEKVSFPLAKSDMTIGRGKGSDIRISSHFISRLHAKISTRGIATTIEDIGSKNGIFVNANRVKRCVLRDGDVVSLASELELKFIDAAH
jgi:chromosome segregation ATPase